MTLILPLFSARRKNYRRLKQLSPITFIFFENSTIRSLPCIFSIDSFIIYSLIAIFFVWADSIVASSR